MSRIVARRWPHHRKLLLVLLSAGFLGGAGLDDKHIVFAVAPFAGVGAQGTLIGKRASSILNLQIWQTLRIPPNPDGNHAQSTIIWDLTARAPATAESAEAFAAGLTDPVPQLVMWGRATGYGGGTVVESFLTVRSGGGEPGFGADLWKVALPGDGELAVGVPRRQIEFAPIVLRSALMPELTDPAGLKLFAEAAGSATLGYVGDYFTAREQGPESAKIILPDGRQGWVRLPNLSRERSEVVDFLGGLVRIFRRDWSGAADLLQRVTRNPHTPTAVKSDSYLYLAVAAAATHGDPFPYVLQAYALSPYSETVLRYLCIAQLARISTQAGTDPVSQAAVSKLHQLVKEGAPLYSAENPWFKRLNAFLERTATSDKARVGSLMSRREQPG